MAMILHHEFFHRCVLRNLPVPNEERQRICAAACRIEGVFSSKTIAIALEIAGTRVSRATLFRTLQMMEEVGVVRRTDEGWMKGI